MVPSRLPDSSPESIPRELTELLEAVRELPEPFRQRLEPLVQQVVESARRKRQVLTMVQEALAQLRLDMKYLVFDLEATRRERDAYRRLVEGNK
ncbi:MAG: transcriptional regulator [Thermoguttaceae bacterium]|nr:transcriptional regulator [Thermoguttaceae bacterium]MDW8077510.1 transcriptional regulator [Thermoguttaceae bacterium]